MAKEKVILVEFLQKEVMPHINLFLLLTLISLHHVLLDWKNYGVDSIVNTVLNHKDLKNGSIILMHNGAKYTAQALPKIIEGLKEKGYEIVPISKLIYKDNFHIEHDGSQVSDKK